jgi:rhodanese-related sulfurtransferase
MKRCCKEEHSTGGADVRKCISFILVFLFGIAAPAFAANYVKPEVFKQWIQSHRSMIIVDIQPSEDFIEGHIKGSIMTDAYPVKTGEDKKRLDAAVKKIKASKDDVVIVCPKGKAAASSAYDYLKSQGIPESRLLILEGGIGGWPYKDMLVTGK